MTGDAEFLPGLRLIEAAIFASRDPVPLRVLATLLPPEADLDEIIAALAARYRGRGVELAETGPGAAAPGAAAPGAAAPGLMFRTAPDLAAELRRVVEVPRRLPRAAMETLAIVAYHQPVTRAEIEEIRGASLSQATIDALIEADLITSHGFKEAPGRPSLWITTPAFLLHFGLQDLRELPKREELLIDPQNRPANL